MFEEIVENISNNQQQNYYPDLGEGEFIQLLSLWFHMATNIHLRVYLSNDQTNLFNLD